jgi:hypothetical protein
VGTKFPLDDLPQPWNWLYYAVHASAYTAVLFLAGTFGERPKCGKELILATQRALEQQALERWKVQKVAQIEQMMRDGMPLGAVAAALASPETAERIAVLEAATSGGLSALEAARLNVRRAGHDLALLGGLDGLNAADRRGRGHEGRSPAREEGGGDGRSGVPRSSAASGVTAAISPIGKPATAAPATTTRCSKICGPSHWPSAGSRIVRW